MTGVVSVAGRPLAEHHYRAGVIAAALVAVVASAVQWRSGPPQLGVVAVVSLLLVPLAVRTQVKISRGQVDLSLGVAAAALFVSDEARSATVLPVWAVLVAASYAVFRRDETGGQFYAAVQVLGGTALVQASRATDLGVGPYDRVFVGLAAYFVTMAGVELGRRLVAPDPQDGRALRLRWTWAFHVGLGALYLGCLVVALRQVENGVPLPVVPSLVVVLIGAVAVAVGLTLRTVELHRSVGALSGAAVAMPWRRDDIDDALAHWGSQGLRVSGVVVREAPGQRGDISVPLPDGRYVVAERTPGDLPFTQVERHVLEALAHMSQTSRRESEHVEELRARANTDGLTGLATYTYFREVLAVVSAARDDGESIGIVFIDLDGFKEINDRYGHLAGDTAIKALADRLLRHTGDPLAVTRYGGDEFAVLVRGVRDYSHLTEECERLRQIVMAPIVVGQDTLRLRASIGSALSSSRGDIMEQVVRAADQQMYQRKRAVHAGDGPISTRIDETVREAILTGGLSTAYQPIVNLETNQVRGVEVLVRHVDPELGSVPPAVIVESATRLNLLDDMTLLVLDQAIATLTESRAVVPDIETFSLNLELEQMATWTPLLERVARCLDDHGVRVVVEISERSIGDWTDAHARTARLLQRRGVLIAIDDFGAGSSGLGSLYLPQVNIVKLDRSLLANLDNPRHALVVTRATSMLLELGFLTVAEGVTTEHEAEVLQQAGTTHVQGYLYGMPSDRSSTVERFRRHGLESVAAPTS